MALRASECNGWPHRWASDNGAIGSQEEPVGSRHLRPLEFQGQRFHGEGLSGGPPGTAFRLTFAEPISGLLALGYGAHFGLGLFVPA